MKKQFLIINLHSFIDVMTNSSSELFVLDKAQSIETVKELLAEMLKHWNQMAVKGIFGDRYVKNERISVSGKELEPKPIHDFDDVFGDIYVYTQEMFNNHKEDIEQGYDWGYEKKENIGRIIIESASDNTIPSEMFDWIESAFGYNTTRYHLG